MGNRSKQMVNTAMFCLLLTGLIVWSPGALARRVGETSMKIVVKNFAKHSFPLTYRELRQLLGAEGELAGGEPGKDAHYVWMGRQPTELVSAWVKDGIVTELHLHEANGAIEMMDTAGVVYDCEDFTCHPDFRHRRPDAAN